MSDIELKLVIKISESRYRLLQTQARTNLGREKLDEFAEAVLNGKLLPKGHGRLIDADALNRKDVNCANVPMNFIDTAQTIIEADKENPLDEYIPMVNEMKQMMRGNTEVVSEFVESDIFDEIMDDESDEETYEKIQEIIEKVKEQKDTYKYLLHSAESFVKENPETIEALQDIQKGESE